MQQPTELHPTRPIHTPPSSLEQSPTKRARLDASTSSLPPPQATATALQPLPLPILLLTLAQSLHSSSLTLHPLLARRPSSPNSLTRYATAWSTYARLLAGAIALLRKCVEVCVAGGDGTGGGRVELRARGLLVECLMEMGGKGKGEAEKVVGKAVSLAWACAWTKGSGPRRRAHSLTFACASLSLLRITHRPLIVDCRCRKGMHAFSLAAPLGP